MVKLEKSSGSLFSNSGKLLLHSKSSLLEAFTSKRHCIGCGLEKKYDELTDEHVLPNWLIRYCSLDRKSMKLPNGQPNRYTADRIKFCSSCNEDFSKNFEIPISNAIKSGIPGVLNLVNSTYGHNLLFSWLSFIAAKRRLNSSLYKYEKDPRKRSIAFEDDDGIDSIRWMLSISNAMRQKNFFNEKSFARLLLVTPSSSKKEKPDNFDIIINPVSDSMALQVGEVMLFANFSDGFPRGDFPLNISGLKNVQLGGLAFRELHAVISCHCLGYDKKFFKFSEHDGKLKISMDDSDCKLIRNIPSSFYNNMVLRLTAKSLCRAKISDERFEYIIEQIKEGTGTFLPMLKDRTFINVHSYADDEIDEITLQNRLEYISKHVEEFDPSIKDGPYEKWDASLRLSL